MGNPATARRRVLLFDKFEGRKAAIAIFHRDRLDQRFTAKDCDRDVEEVGRRFGQQLLAKNSVRFKIAQ